MSNQTKTYDPSQIILQIGPHIATGYADGTFVKAGRDVETFTKSVGADGEPVRVRSRNKGGSFEFTLQQSSPSNDYLSELAIQDEISGNGIVPVTVKDMNGTTLVFAGEAWVQKPADAEFGKDLANRTWKLDTGRLSIFNGQALS